MDVYNVQISFTVFRESISFIQIHLYDLIKNNLNIMLTLGGVNKSRTGEKINWN